MIGLEADNQTIVLQTGWRYEIVNNGFPAHPLELVTLGADRVMDMVALSQQPNNDAMLETDMMIDWVEDANTLRFTVAGGFQGAVTGYHCSVPSHPDMRGAFMIE